MLQKIASTRECSSATTTFNATLKWFLLSRRGQVRDPRHQRGAKRLQDGHLQQDQERHEACRQVERNTNNNNDNLSVPSPRLSEVTEKVAFSIVFNDDCNMPPVDLASHFFISSISSRTWTNTNNINKRSILTIIGRSRRENSGRMGGGYQPLHQLDEKSLWKNSLWAVSRHHHLPPPPHHHHFHLDEMSLWKDRLQTVRRHHHAWFTDYQDEFPSTFSNLLISFLKVPQEKVPDCR